MRSEGIGRWGKTFCSNECLEADEDIDAMVRQRMDLPPKREEELLAEMSDGSDDGPIK